MLKTLPLILDTDIGSDIDDSWALTMILKSPELDLKLVSVCAYDTPYQAKVAIKLLKAAGREDIPVAVGRGGVKCGNPLEKHVSDISLEDYAELRTDAADALIDTIMNSNEKITVLCIGNFMNIEDAYKKCPEIAKKCRIVAIAGNIYSGHCKGWYPGITSEWNIRCSLEAWKNGIEHSDFEVELLPLDVSGNIYLDGDKFQRIRKAAETDRLLDALISSNDSWFEEEKWNYTGSTSPLFDTVGVYACITHENLNFQMLPVYSSDASITYIDPERGKNMNVALSWDDKERFYKFLTARLCGEI